VRVLETVVISSVCVIRLEYLLSNVIVECLRECVGEWELQVVESFAILSPKLSLSKYRTHIDALNVVDELSAEEVGHAAPPPAHWGYCPLQGVEEEAAELLGVVLHLHLLL
jgi:hypothetical protein